MSIILNFFTPYIDCLRGAAYVVQQTLEGIGFSTSNFVIRDATGVIVESYWSPWQAAMVPLGVLLLYSIFLVLLMILAAYILGRMRGVLITLLLLALPGVFNVLGLLPEVNYVADIFYIGGRGALGSPWGLLPLLVLGAMTGWSGVIFVVDIFDLGEKFRHCYDHLWYALAVLAGLFFVADSSTQNMFRELQDQNQLARQASAYLLNQVRDFDRQCRVDSSIREASCDWASRVQQKLSEYSATDAQTFYFFGPESSADIYSADGRQVDDQDIAEIRRQIMAYNDIRYPVTVVGDGFVKNTMSGTCQLPPPNFCVAFADPLDGKTNEDLKWKTVALASECIIPTLVRSRKLQEKYAAVVSHNSINKHYRWLFYIMFSVVLGGKLANSTSQALKLDKREAKEKHRLWHMLRRIVRVAIYVMGVVKRYVFTIFRHVASAARK